MALSIQIMSNNQDDLSTFELSEDYIELIKLLKLLNLVESGADAKFVVSNGEVLVNGVIELRKRKKLISGDVIIFDGNTIKIV